MATYDNSTKWREVVVRGSLTSNNQTITVLNPTGAGNKFYFVIEAGVKNDTGSGTVTVEAVQADPSAPFQQANTTLASANGFNSDLSAFENYWGGSTNTRERFIGGDETLVAKTDVTCTSARYYVKYIEFTY